MAEVAVTVGPMATAAEYASRMGRIKDFVQRLHVDIADGQLVPAKTIDLAQAYDIDDVATDLHLMVKNPGKLVEMVISFGPSLVICHAEAQANRSELFDQWREVGIKVGLALEAQTSVDAIKDLIPDLDHVLVFTGDHIGFNHSHFQAGSLDKIAQIKVIKPDIEVGVDGGLDAQHAAEAVAAGADVINVGGFVVDASNPQAAYGELVTALEVKSDPKS